MSSTSSRRLAWSALRRCFREERRWVAALLALLVATVAMQIEAPLILGDFVDRALAGSERAVLLRLATGFTALALASQVTTVIVLSISERLGWRTTNRLRADLCRHVLAQGHQFFSRFSSGELIERVDGDVNTLANYFSQFTAQLLANLALLAGIQVTLFVLDWRLGLASMTIVGLAFVVYRPIHRRASAAWAHAREGSASMFGWLGEVLAATEDIAATRRAPSFVRNLFAGRALAVRRLYRRARLVDNATFIAADGLFFLADAVTLGIAIYLLGRGELALGTVVAVYHYSSLTYTPMQQLRTQAQDFQQASASLARLSQLLAEPALVEPAACGALPAGALGCSLERVSFAYHGEPVLTETSLSIAPAEVVGLVGRTGAGKTTIARLLARTCDPTAGVVRVADVDVRTLALDHLRHRVAYLPQDGQLLAGTLRDNITLFDSSVEDEAIVALADRLGLAGWLGARARGLDTIIEPSGDSLSAGERQLVVLFRVALRDPGLVILDEPSSRLDPASERDLVQAIGRLLVGRTALIIAHRPTLLGLATRIVRLADGQLDAEQGAAA